MEANLVMVFRTALRNVTTPPIVVPLSFSYNISFSPQSPGRFIAPIALGNTPQKLSLALDISRSDMEIRHDMGIKGKVNDPLRQLLFKNSSSSSFEWGVPAGDLNGWL